MRSSNHTLLQNYSMLTTLRKRFDTQHNGTLQNDTQQTDNTLLLSQFWTISLSIIMLIAVMPSVVMVSVVVPFDQVNLTMTRSSNKLACFSLSEITDRQNVHRVRLYLSTQSAPGRLWPCSQRLNFAVKFCQRGNALAFWLEQVSMTRPTIECIQNYFSLKGEWVLDLGLVHMQILYLKTSECFQTYRGCHVHPTPPSPHCPPTPIYHLKKGGGNDDDGASSISISQNLNIFNVMLQTQHACI